MDAIQASGTHAEPCPTDDPSRVQPVDDGSGSSTGNAAHRPNAPDAALNRSRLTAPPAAGPVSLRCREIGEDDLDAVVRLLMRGFPDRTEAFWRRGLARHVARPLPQGHARYGYMLVADGSPVGVLLTLHTETAFASESVVRCNLSSWYVEPRFRSYGALLDKVAQRRRDVTFLNVTPAPQTWALQEARGAIRYCGGQMLTIPALSRLRRGVSIRAVEPGDPLSDLSPAERDLLTDHLSYGCLCLVWSDGVASRPLILQKRHIRLTKSLPKVRLPIYQVIYCRSADDLPRVSAVLGRLLLRRRAVPWMLIDADGPVPGMVGRFFAGRSIRFTRGPHPVRLGDLAYTELVLFGL